MKSHFVLLWIIGYVVTALAQSPGTFTSTGNMTAPRVYHTATLLTNGKVLITGGAGPSSTGLASAELYDASTQTFTATGDMTTPRVRHSATLLPNGKVLIAGGFSPQPVSSAELYDPSTGTFTATGDMNTANAWHSAILLSSGKVLVAGRELYDPSTGTFAALLGQDIAEFSDPAAGVFNHAGHLIYPNGTSRTLLPNGKVLFADGYFTELGCSASTELYDPLTDASTATGNLTPCLSAEAATLLPEGRAFIAGGDSSNGSNVAGIAELYDPVTGTFSAAGGTRSAAGHAVPLLPDATLLTRRARSFTTS